MPRQFECLRCGHVTHPLADPPRCEQCGSGNGIIEPSGPADPRRPATPPVEPEQK